MLFTLSLTRRIAFSAALLALLSVALTGGTAFVILRGQVMDTMHHSLEHSAEDVGRVIENRLDTISDTLTTLAGNTLMANALADNEGRKRYLSSFLEGYQTIAGLPVDLWLTDFQGSPLSSPVDTPLVFDPAWVAQRVDNNDPAATLVEGGDETWLVVARPVIYANTGLPEGALVLQFRLNQLMTLPTEVAHIDDWRHSAHFALYLGEEIPAQTNFFAGLPEPEDGVGLRYPLRLPADFAPLKSELEVAIDPTRFNAPLRHLLYSATALALLVLLLVTAASMVLSRTLTRRLRHLEEVAHQVTLDKGKHTRLPVTGGDEVTSLAHSFNRLLDDLQRAFDELQHKSDSLESALTEAREARNEAEQANRSKSVFLANMSHELRTPLNAILGFAQLLQRDPAVGSSQRKTLTTIYRSGQHLLSLINDVLEISRIEAGRQELVEAPFDLHELLSSVTDVLRLRAEEKGLTLTLETADEMPGYIEGDQRKLRQVLINLLGNAIKFTDDGWVRLRAGLEGEQLRLEVADSGQGIGAEELAHIFEPFQQGQSEHRQEGTGLGLAISHEFVTLMGGEIGVNSILGEGTTFHLLIPFHRAEEGPLTQGRGEQQVVALLPDQPEYRILVVDDKAEGRELLANVLDSVGFKVRCAEDGAEALKLFQHWQPHAIWMDMRMPVMDGFEATRRIRATPEGKKTVIIALTASAFEEDRNAVIEAGCDDFMRKPIDTDEVFEVMARLLGVGYRYARGAESTTAAEGDFDLNAAIAAQPPELCVRLAQAASALNVGLTREAIAAIDEDDPQLALRLTALAEEYRYDELARLCGQDNDHAE